MDAHLFGWLPHRIDAAGAVYQIRTLSDFDEVVAGIEKSDRVAGGWYWPPIISGPPMRPAPRFKLSNTHGISVATGSVTEEGKLAEFIIAILGFLYDILLLPNGWVHLYRVSICPGLTQDFLPTDEARERIVKASVKTWLGRVELRDALFGAVRWHTFAASYEHTFERFLAEYTVLDACWAIHRACAGLRKDPKHGERVRELAKAYDLVPPEEWSFTGTKDLLSKTRNDLVHEAKWGARPIGFGLPDWPNESIDHTLRCFNSRLLLALLGEQSDYVHSRHFANLPHYHLT